MSDEEKKPKNRCWLTVLGYTGGAFIALAACADNLEKHLFGTGTVWIIGGSFIAGCWAFEQFCWNGDDNE